MKLPKFILSILIVAATLTSCNNTGSLGNSLVEGQSQVVIDSTFVLTGRSVVNPKIQSRSITQLLGRIDAKGYGKFESEFVTEFMSSALIDTTDVTVNDIDSLRLIMRIPTTDIIGDSLTPMGLAIYPLTKKLPSPIYSDFDPADYYDQTPLVPSSIYKLNALSSNDTIYAEGQRYITVTLPKSLGQKLYEIYKENPANYATPSAFTSKFPGFYIKNSFGDGRVIRIAQTVMRLHYHKTVKSSVGTDSLVRYVGYYYGVQPEIVTNNIIDYNISADLTNKLNNGENIIVAPAGRDIEITFPAQDVIDAYLRQSGKLAVLNTLSLRVPAETIENDYGITPPSTVLMILSKDKDKFFVENNVTDDVTSFLGYYDSTNKCYDFAGMRSYIIDMMKKGTITPEDCTFTITPVSLLTTTETSTSYYYYTTSSEQVYAVVPYTEKPTMAKINISKAKIVLTFSKQVINF